MENAISTGEAAAAASTNEQARNVFHIPDSNYSLFQRELERINRRAKKLGFAEIGFELLDTYVKTGKVAIDEFVNRDVMTTMYKVRVDGEQPVLSGWRFLGKLEHIDMAGNNIIKGDIPKEYFGCKPNCEHCNKLRKRSETFILQSATDAKLMQVGRSCLTDFFNSDDPLRYAAFLELVLAFKEQLSDFEEHSFGSGSTSSCKPLDALTVAAAVTGKWGWITAQVAEERMMEPSAMTVRLILSGAVKPSEAPKIDEHHRLEAQAVLDWLALPEIAEQAADNSYMHNLVALANAEAISHKNAGILGSAVVAHARYLASRESRATDALSEHVGTVTEKIESYPVTVIGKVIIPSEQWGDKTLYRFRDDEGNLLVWFSSGADIARAGDRIHINGSVKEHSIYKGTKQTGLLRVNTNEAKFFNAVSSGKDVAAVKKLLKKPVNLNQPDFESGMTPLMVCASDGTSDVMRVLLDAAASPDIVTPKASAAIYHAVENGRSDCVELLKEYGADLSILDKAGRTFEEAYSKAQACLATEALQRRPFARPELEVGIDAAIWRQDHSLPIDALVAPDGGWQDWFAMQCAQAEEYVGTPHHHRMKLLDYTADDPITVVMVDGRAIVADGEKRVGLAVRNGAKTIAAYVAMPRQQPELGASKTHAGTDHQMQP